MTDRLLFNTVHSKITRLSPDKIGLEQLIKKYLAFNFKNLIRELYCIPKYVNGTDQLWRHMVDVVHCKDHEIPTQTEECNRCFAFGLLYRYLVNICKGFHVQVIGRRLTGLNAVQHVD